MPDTLVETAPVTNLDDENKKMVATVGQQVEQLGHPAESVQPTHSVIPGQDPTVEKIHNQFIPIPGAVVPQDETPANAEDQLTGDFQDVLNGIQGRIRTAPGSDFLKAKMEDARRRGMKPEDPQPSKS